MREKIMTDELSGKRKHFSLRTEGVKHGEFAYTIGNPLGLGLSIAQGVVSNPHCTSIAAGRWDSVIQTDISAHHGNSGGALFDQNNNVIGMITFTPCVQVEGQPELSVGASNLAMCVPAEYIAQAIKQI